VIVTAPVNVYTKKEEPKRKKRRKSLFHPRRKRNKWTWKVYLIDLYLNHSIEIDVKYGYITDGMCWGG
jgi:hypothetical protein